MVKITLAELTPVALCIQTDDLFDFKTFQSSFGDHIVLRERDQELSELIIQTKRELNSTLQQTKFLDGYKLVLVRNLDRIMSLVQSRYSSIDKDATDKVLMSCRNLIKKVLIAENFQKIQELEPIFKREVLLKVYALFSQTQK
ncbi:MAG: hypothetical protein RQ930_02115 [Candidatus Aenigmarchaeota archaeon]|jgi:hypothetical protein|nr:hypothetical protein [Candidatus Aenigmarchaeota archaeon]